jgi:putative nucleotidyltransferase with HDIG domain
VEGFKIGKSNSFLEKVLYNKNEIGLLTRGDGVEILLQTIQKDRLFYVFPSNNPDVLEFYFIISGEIICELNDEKILLGPNDYFSSKGIIDPVHFTALTNVTFLWITTEPTFVHISKDISALMETAKQVEVKDRYTYNHCDRVANYSIKIARKMKLEKAPLENLNTASYLHDIGKVNVPESILQKPSKLTNEEFAIIKRHPIDGANLIRGTYYNEIAPIIEQHHERLNGSGYPYGLKGEEILLEARIIAVSDTFDAMTEDRVYRKASTAREAFDEIKRLSGIQYDPEVVDAFEKVLIEEGKI